MAYGAAHKKAHHGMTQHIMVYPNILHHSMTHPNMTQRRKMAQRGPRGPSFC